MQRLVQLSLLLFILGAGFFVYQPGLSGTFVFDDGPNIVSNSSLAIHDLKLDSLRQAAFSRADSGPLMRPISMLSFAANYYATGLDPFYFKLTNVAIHLFNGTGIFVLTSILLGIYRKRFEPTLSASYTQYLSLAIAAAWLLHPLNLTGVLYVVQRMTSLSALFSIWGLVLFVWGRVRLFEGKSGVMPVLASLLLFTPLAMLSKEVGALLPLLMLVTEISFFNFHAKKQSARRFLAGFYILAVAVPAIAVLAYMAMHPAWLLAGYSIRDFTLVERLMTEARVLWFYIRLIILPSTAQMGLFHDDIIVSHGLLQPFTTALSLAGILSLFALSFLLRERAPLLTFGVLIFLVGHVLESTVFPLEIAHEHRNYLPMYGILLPLFFYLLYPLNFTKTLRLRQAGAFLLISLFAFSTFARASKWSNLLDLAKSEVEHHPSSTRANNGMGSIYGNLITPDPDGMERNYALARQHYEKAINLDVNTTQGLFSLIMLSSARHKAVEQIWLAELSRRLEQAPFAVDVSEKLFGLVDCQKNGVCELPKGTIEGLLQAALRNPTLMDLSRAEVLYVQSYYLINVIRDYPAALAVSYQMVEAAPRELEPRLNLIKFLIALKRFVEAKEQLATLKRLDALRRYTHEIELQRKLIDVQLANGLSR